MTCGPAPRRGEWRTAEHAAQVLQRALARWLGLPCSGKVADLVIGQVVQAAADLGERQVFGLKPADQAQSREVALVVLGARSGLPDGRQQALGEVVADGPRGDPGKVGKLGQRVAFVIWHRPIMTVQRDTVKTQARRLGCRPNAMGPLRSLHIGSTTRLQDSRQTGSAGIPPTDKGVHCMSRVIAAILLVIVLVVGGGIIATTAYNAGISAGTTVTTTTADDATAVTPVVVAPYAYGWHGFGWGGGWGIFGFFFFLFFLFIVFALLRAIFWGGRGRWGRGWGPGYGPGGWYGDTGPNGPGRGGWESHAHETFDDWHQRAHGGSGSSTTNEPGSGSPTPPAPPTQTGMA